MSKLNVPEAEERARKILDDEASVIQPSPMRIRDAQTILALADLARRLARHANENTGHEPSVSLLARTLDEARAAGLLPKEKK